MSTEPCRTCGSFSEEEAPVVSVLSYYKENLAIADIIEKCTRVQVLAVV
jgi:hypothetical protein